MSPTGGDLTVYLTDRGAVAAYTQWCNLAHTLLLVSSKSGTTIETPALFKYFYNQVATQPAPQETPELTRMHQETTEIQTTLMSMCVRIRDQYGLAATTLDCEPYGWRLHRDRRGEEDGKFARK